MPRRKPKPMTRDLRFCPRVTVRASTVNEDAMTVEATLSTENPVPMFDYARYEVLDEVLLADGVQLPNSRQVPLLNSHNRMSMAHQLGSVRSIHAHLTETRGTLAFSSVHTEEFQLCAEGHATDVSVGYAVLKREFIAAGKTKRINGRDFHGPVNVVTKWRLIEVSLTPIGANEEAKLRGLDPATITRAVARKTPRRRGTSADVAALSVSLAARCTTLADERTALVAELARWVVEAQFQRERADRLQEESNRMRW